MAKKKKTKVDDGFNDNGTVKMPKMPLHPTDNEDGKCAPDTVKHMSPGEIAFAIKDICLAITDIRARIDRIVEAHEKCKSLKGL